MGNFVDYLDNFEKKFESKVIQENVERPKKVKKKFVIKKKKIINESNSEIAQATSVLEIFLKQNNSKSLPTEVNEAVNILQNFINKKTNKKTNEEIHDKTPMNEVSRATAILDGIDDCGFDPGMPASSRYYNDEGVKPPQLSNSKSILEGAANILGGDDGDYSEGSSNGLPPVLMEIPKMDEEMLRNVPQEMLPAGYKQQVKQQEKIEKVAEENSKKEIPPELQKMMEDTKRMQQMFSNVDMSNVNIPNQF